MSGDQAQPEATLADRGLTRPRSVLIASLLLSVPWLWSSTSTVDFNGSPSLSGFQTGGWFVLGFPTVLIFGGALGMVCCAVARRTNKWVGTGLAAVIFGALTVTAVVGKLPSSRLPRILGDLNWNQVQIHRFRIHDSFNEGETTEGVLGLSPQTFATIASEQKLKAEEGQPTGAFTSLEGDVGPMSGIVWSNERTRAFYDEARQRLYFSHHSGRR